MADRSTERLHIAALVVAAGFLINVVFHYVQGFYLGKPYPFNTCMFNPQVMFQDFDAVYQGIKGFKPYFPDDFTPSNYFPFANFIFYPFTWIGYFPLANLCFILLFLAAYAWGSYLLLAQTPRVGPSAEMFLPFFIICFMSYPLLFNLDRANIETYLYLAMSAFMLSYVRQRYCLSALFLAMAIAMKFFAVIFLLAYIAKKQWRPIFLAAGFTMALTLIPLWLFEGGFVANLSALAGALGSFGTRYIDDPFKTIQHSTSFYAVVRLLYLLKFDTVDIDFKIPYAIAMTAILLPLSGYIIFRPLAAWQRIYLITFVFILFPFISFDYRLIHLNLPLFLLINSTKKERFELPILIGFSLLLIPKDYGVFGLDISVNVLLNPLIMTFMAGLVIYGDLTKCRCRTDLPSPGDPANGPLHPSAL